VRANTKELFSVPNFLSTVRLILIPFFIYEYVTADRAEDYYFAAIIVVLSGLTDLLDGFIARNFNQTTDLGKVLDPIADKLTQAAIAACLLLRYKYMWVLFILFAVKELFMAINSLILLKRGKKLNGAMWFGKLSTAVFYVAMFFLVAFPGIDPVLAGGLMIITGIFLSLSFFMYIPVFMKMYHNA